MSGYGSYPSAYERRSNSTLPMNPSKTRPSVAGINTAFNPEEYQRVEASRQRRASFDRKTKSYIDGRSPIYDSKDWYKDPEPARSSSTADRETRITQYLMGQSYGQVRGGHGASQSVPYGYGGSKAPTDPSSSGMRTMWFDSPSYSPKASHASGTPRHGGYSKYEAQDDYRKT